MANQSLQFDAKGFDLFSSNQPQLVLENGTTIPVSGYNFTANNQVMFRKFCARNYLSGNLTARIRWYSQTGQTTGNAQFSAAIAAITPGDAQSVLTKALATATNTTTTVNGTARGDTTTDVVISNLDSLAEGDDVWLAISKIGGTITGGVVIMSVEILYAATGGVGAGDVNGPASATDNAIARFDLTTGKVIQNSACLVADTTGALDNSAASGTMTSTRFIGPATGLRETGGPTDLAMASVSDQQIFKRSGTDIVGVDLVKGNILTSDSAAITTTLTTVYSLTLNSTSSWYWFDAFLSMVQSTTTANAITIQVNFTGTFSAFVYDITSLFTSEANRVSGSFNSNTQSITISPNVTTPFFARIRGGIVVTGNGDLQVKISRATSGNVVAKAGSTLVISEI